MKNPTHKDIAIYVSGFTTLIVLVFLIVLSFFWSIPVVTIVIVPLATLISSYLLIIYTVERFIYRKIKVIYKSIHNLKTGKRLKRQFEQNENVLEGVEQEVLEYTKTKTAEIEELKKMEQYRKEFLGNVSHELKTPIFNIQGYIHTLLDGAFEDKNVNRDYLYKASSNAERLSDIVEELMLISQYESGKLLLEMEKFDIKELAQEQISALEMQAERRNIRLNFKKGITKSFIVFADRERITQVLNNLISNSIKYGNEKGKTNIGIYDMDENVLIEVSDDGPGIPQEHLPRLFERFYRVDSSRSRELGGTGLGLSIVKHIIEAHNQSVTVRSSIGKGTTFGFTLKKATSQD